MVRSISAQVGGQMASQKATTFADDIITPLLSEEKVNAHKKKYSQLQNANRATTESTMSDDLSIGGPEGEDELNDDKAPMLTPTQVLKHMAVVLVTGAGAAASVSSFLFSPAILVYVAGGFCLLNTPMVLLKEWKISKIPTLRNSTNSLRQSAQRLKEQVNSLRKEIDALKFEQTRFDEVEEELNYIAEKQGITSEKIIGLVKENEFVLDAMKENIRQKVLQDVVAIVVRSDQDNDMRFDRVEAKLLSLKITVKLEVYGIGFDEEKFLRAVSLNPSLFGVISIVKHLLPGADEIDNANVDEELDEDDIYDMFYMSKEEQKERGSVQAVRAMFEGARGVSLRRNLSYVTRRRVSTREKNTIEEYDSDFSE